MIDLYGKLRPAVMADDSNHGNGTAEAFLIFWRCTTEGVVRGEGSGGGVELGRGWGRVL